MIPYRKPPENIIITTKIVNETKVYIWNNKPYATEYLARKAAERAAREISKSINNFCV